MSYSRDIVRDIAKFVKIAAKRAESESFFGKVYETAKDFARRFDIPLSVAAGGVIGTLIGTKYGPAIKRNWSKFKAKLKLGKVKKRKRKRSSSSTQGNK